MNYHARIAGLTRIETLRPPLISSIDQDTRTELEFDKQIDPYMGFSGGFILLLHRASEILLLDLSDQSNVDSMMKDAVKM